MAEKRTRSSGPGWLATLLGAAVLVVLGFGLGLVSGAAYEEPTLVAEHLAGRTVDVALPDRAAAPEAALLPPVSATPPAAPEAAPASPEPTTSRSPLGGGGSPAPKAQSAPTPAPAKAVAALSPASGFNIQVGAFGERSAAEGLSRTLRSAGYPVHIAEEGGGARFKVRVGPVSSRAEADRLSARLKSRQQLPTWVIKPDAS